MTGSTTPRGAHRIRLAGVWEIARSPEPATAAGASPGAEGERAVAWTRVRLDRLPAGGLPFPPAVCRRFFHRPTNLAEGQPVFLELSGLAVAVRIGVNGRLAAETDGGAEFVRVRIDERLAERNEVTLETLSEASLGEDREENASAIWPFRECSLAIEPVAEA